MDSQDLHISSVLSNLISSLRLLISSFEFWIQWNFHTLCFDSISEALFDSLALEKSYLRVPFKNFFNDHQSSLIISEKSFWKFYPLFPQFLNLKNYKVMYYPWYFRFQNFSLEFCWFLSQYLITFEVQNQILISQEVALEEF